MNSLRRSTTFSALQRAENSSIYSQGVNNAKSELSVLFSEPKIPQCLSRRASTVYGASFQCSSASRKFLNRDRQRPPRAQSPAFQCSSASRKFLNTVASPKRSTPRRLSVLFSEPKIPQYCRYVKFRSIIKAFSALQRAENSSMMCGLIRSAGRRRFQCSSASRKFLNDNVA